MNKDILHSFLVSNGFTQEEINLANLAKISETEWIASAPMLPKRFINQVLIKEMEAVVGTSPWLAFISIGCAIEFLGKCIDTDNPTDWNAESNSSKNFRDAIYQLTAFKKYEHLNTGRGLTKKQIKESGVFDLYTEFRCALAHSYAPNSRVSLSHGDKEEKNLVEKNGVINFNIDELYEDFKAGCEEVRAMDFPDPTNKMNNPRIWITISIKPNTLKTESTSSKG